MTYPYCSGHQKDSELEIQACARSTMVTKVVVESDVGSENELG